MTTTRTIETLATKEVAMYFVAFPVIGFRSSSLRVRLVEDKGSCAIVVTADLLDAGTTLVLDWSKLSPEGGEAVALPIHRNGLVAFA